MSRKKQVEDLEQDLERRLETLAAAEYQLSREKIRIARMLLRQSMHCLAQAQELLNEESGEGKKELISPELLDHSEPPHLI